MNKDPHPTTRFSDRVDDYVRYRPGYPRETISDIREVCDARSGATIADIGCGTGILARPFLELGYRVFGVEPNRPMREAAERALGRFPGFSSLDGSAEDTGLPDRSVDLVLAGQAFHWFDPARARAEFLRVLRNPAWVALLWNDRVAPAPSGFAAGYEQLLLEFGTDYRAVDHRRVDEGRLRRFFGHDDFVRSARPNRQVFDRTGLRGRTASASYMPGPGQPGYDAWTRELDRLFERFQQDEKVTMEQETKMFAGKIG